MIITDFMSSWCNNYNSFRVLYRVYNLSLHRNRDRWGDIYANTPVKKMIALYDYDPHELSPNVDLEVELPFRTGDVIYVYGDMDDDGFYLAELRGQRGLVPSNFLSEVPNQGGRPGGPGAVGPPVQPRGGPAGKKG